MSQGRKGGGIESGCCVREGEPGLNLAAIEKRVIKEKKEKRREKKEGDWMGLGGKTGELASFSLCGAGRQGS